MKIKVQKNQHSQAYEFDIQPTGSLLSQGEILSVSLGNKELKLQVIADGRSFLVGKKIVHIGKKIDRVTVSIVRPVEPRKVVTRTGGGDMKSPMTGKVLTVLVKDGAEVKKGETLLIIEAMKMENKILAEIDGIVKNIKMSVGDNVTTGDFLLSITQVNVGS